MSPVFWNEHFRNMDLFWHLISESHKADLGNGFKLVRETSERTVLTVGLLDNCGRLKALGGKY